MRRTIRAAALIAVLASALAVGCGDDDRVAADNAYVARTNAAVQRFETQFQQLQTAFTPVSTAAQDQQTLALLRQSVDRVVGELQRIQAPPRIATLHAGLITQLMAYDGVITAATARFKGADAQQTAAARARLSTDLAAVATRITSTITLINQRLQ